MLAVQKLRIGLTGLALFSVIQAVTAVVGLTNINNAQSDFSTRSFPVLAQLNQINTRSAEIAENALEFASATSPGQVVEISSVVTDIYSSLTQNYERAVALDPALKTSNLLDLIREVRTQNRDLKAVSQERFSLEDEFESTRADVQLVLRNLLYETEAARDQASLSLGDPAGDISGVSTFRRLFQIHELAQKMAFRLDELTQEKSVSDIAELEALVMLHSRDLHASITRVSRSRGQRQIASLIVDLHDAINIGSLFEKRTAITTGLAAEKDAQTALRETIAQLRSTAQDIAIRQAEATQLLDDQLTALVSRTSAYLIFWSLVGVLATISMIVLVVERQISRRLSMVGRNAARIEAADFSRQPPFSGTDEISALGRSLDRLREMSANKEKIHEEMRVASVAAQQAAQTKSEFLAMMSHEVRTPLNAILGLFELMLRSDLPDKQLKRAKAGHKAATNLFKMLSDILDASRLEAGKMDRYFEDMHVSDLCEYIEILMQGINEKHSKDLEMKIERYNIDDFVIRTDEMKVRQILTNLIDNAVRFTDSGSVSVIFERNTGNNVVSITVKDTGCGIQPEQLGRVFESFRQVDMGIRRATGGSGLGLTISKDLAKLIGGELAVESKLGAGSSFRLTLPMAPKELANAA